jgi:hypothetical protein
MGDRVLGVDGKCVSGCMSQTPHITSPGTGPIGAMPLPLTPALLLSGHIMWVELLGRVVEVYVLSSPAMTDMQFELANAQSQAR